jgi:hypothetical protein
LTREEYKEWFKELFCIGLAAGLCISAGYYIYKVLIILGN